MAKKDLNSPADQDQHPWDLVLLLPEEAAKILKASVDTLADWRVDGRGPQWITVGRLIRYRECDLRKWLESRMHQNTGTYPRNRR
jgi:predicted DNA-binding transcriptional regulator AlpA